jgi:ribonuclease P protein component
MSETSLLVRPKQFRPTRFQQLSVLNTGGADRLASSAAKAAINMEFERRRIRREFVFLNRTHQVDSSAWAIVLVAGENIGGTGFQTETAMNTRKELMFFGC